MYNAAQFRRLLRSVPEFELCDVFDFWYELDSPMKLNDELGDAAIVLRRVLITLLSNSRRSPTMSHESIQKIIESQRDFFNSNRTKNVHFRLEMLKKLKQAILDHEDDIRASLQEDFDVEGQYDTCGRLVFILDELNYFIKNLKRWTKPVKVRTSKLLFPGKSHYIHEPLGVTLLIAAWNAPYLVNFFTLFASIAAGNCTNTKTVRVERSLVESAGKNYWLRFRPGLLCG